MSPTTMVVELVGGRWDGLIVDAELWAKAIFVDNNGSNSNPRVAFDGLVKGVKAEDHSAYGITEQRCENVECKGHSRKYARFSPPAVKRG